MEMNKCQENATPHSPQSYLKKIENGRKTNLSIYLSIKLFEEKNATSKQEENQLEERVRGRGEEGTHDLMSSEVSSLSVFVFVFVVVFVSVFERKLEKRGGMILCHQRYHLYLYLYL